MTFFLIELCPYFQGTGVKWEYALWKEDMRLPRACGRVLVALWDSGYWLVAAADTRGSRGPPSGDVIWRCLACKETFFFLWSAIFCLGLIWPWNSYPNQSHLFTLVLGDAAHERRRLYINKQFVALFFEIENKSAGGYRFWVASQSFERRWKALLSLVSFPPLNVGTSSPRVLTQPIGFHHSYRAGEKHLGFYMKSASWKLQDVRSFGLLILTQAAI